MKYLPTTREGVLALLNSERLSIAIGKGYRDWNSLAYVPGLVQCNNMDAQNTITSRLETMVYNYLYLKGFRPVKRSVKVPDLYRPGSTWVMTPDFILSGTNIVVEVDCYNPRYSRHNKGFPAEDLFRTDSLRNVGYRVFRLRLGDIEPVEGATNIISPHTYISRDMLDIAVSMLSRLIETGAVVLDTVSSTSRSGSLTGIECLYLRDMGDGAKQFMYNTKVCKVSPEGVVSYLSHTGSWVDILAFSSYSNHDNLQNLLLDNHRLLSENILTHTNEVSGGFSPKTISF